MPDATIIMIQIAISSAAEKAAEGRMRRRAGLIAKISSEKRKNCPIGKWLPAMNVLRT